MPTQPVPPSGEQIVLRSGEQEVVVTAVGAGLRSYRVGDRAVLDGFGVEEPADGARGQLLLPWPNRIDGGRYEFGGEEHELALTEPALGNAIHGLVRWTPFAVVERSGSAVTLRALLPAQQGWPFVLECTQAYSLGADGLAVRTTAVNVGATACPYAAGAHPYLAAGGGPVDAAVVTVPGERYQPVDDRGIPTGVEAVDGTRYDLRAPTVLGDREIDVAYRDLTRDADGRARVRFRPPTGPEVALWVSTAYPYLEVFTGDTLDPARRRRGLGVEPMTAPPNAFRTGESLVVLAPGDSHEAEWGIEPGT